jgi:Kdo2-lipid IVA lauroyltransferase/acyltransferase
MPNLFRLMAHLPLRLLYFVGDALYLFTYDVLRWRRQLTLDNLRNAFPDMTEAERARIARDSYRHLGQFFAEGIRGGAISKQEIGRRVRIINPEVITQYTDRGQSVLLLTSHQCNWEWLLLAAGAQLGIPVDALYKPQRFKPMDRFLRGMRSRFGGNPIPRDQFLVEVLKRKGNARAFAMVADHTPHRSDEKYWTRFLNQDTAFFVGADKIARLTRSPVIFVGMRRLSRGLYEAVPELLGAPPYTGDMTDVIERYARAAERQIIAAPGDWLWLHRKWKYPKPAYA